MSRCLLAMTALLIAVAGCDGRADTTVRLTNADSVALDSLVVHVTGRSYPLGRLAPGETRTVEVDPLGESHVELTQAAGPRLVVGTYFEHGYGATVSARVRRDSVLEVDTRY